MRRLLLLLCMSLLAGCASSDSEFDDAAPPITIEGEQAFDEDELLEFARREMRSFRQNEHAAADLYDAAYSMQTALRDRGYARARVELDVDLDGRTVRSATFRVDEGQRAQFVGVTFTGNDAIPTERLATAFEFTRFRTPWSDDPLYRPEAIEQAVIDVREMYLLTGYVRATVGPQRTEWDESGTRAHVHLPIVEGPRYTVQSVKLNGKFPADLRLRLKEAAGLTGEAYRPRIRYEAAARVRSLLLEEGRLLAHVEPITMLDDEAHVARIELRIDAGPIVRLGTVNVQGEDRTRRGFVRERVDAESGDVLSQSAIDRAVDDLYASGIFSTVRPRVRPVDGTAPPEDTADEIAADLDIVVEERIPRRVEFEAGWGSYELLRGRAGYRDINFAGTGRMLDLELSGSLKSAGLRARGEDRHLLGRDFLVEVDLSFETREEPSFDTEQVEFVSSVRWDAREDLYLRGGYLLRASEATSIDGKVRGIEEDGFVRSAGLFAGAGRDTRDDPLFPADGSLIEANVFWSDPAFGADLEYAEFRTQVARYFEIDHDTVLAAGVRFVTREVLDEQRTLPIQERLFLGGATTVRSFREDELGPSDVDGDPLGGLTALMGSIELRRRLWRELDGALFWDVGTVSRRSFQTGSEVGHAIGVGLRYRLPVGPVRLDVGYNPGERFAAGRVYTIHLSFGFSF